MYIIFITGLFLGDIMAVNREITTVEYEIESESLHMTEGDCPRLDDSGIPLLKDVRCVINDAGHLLPFTKYLADETEFTKIYGRVLHLLNVPVLPFGILIIDVLHLGMSIWFLLLKNTVF
jgi:hypothetical protein